MCERAAQIQEKYLMGFGACKCPISLPPGVHEEVVERICLDKCSPRFL